MMTASGAPAGEQLRGEDLRRAGEDDRAHADRAEPVRARGRRADAADEAERDEPDARRAAFRRSRRGNRESRRESAHETGVGTRVRDAPGRHKSEERQCDGPNRLASHARRAAPRRSRIAWPTTSRPGKNTVTPERGPPWISPSIISSARIAAGAHARRHLACRAASPSTAEALGCAGFDFLVVDTEHTPVDVPQMIEILRTIAGHAGAGDRAPAVERHGDDQARARRRRADAAAAVRAECRRGAGAPSPHTRYPPEGVRGVAGTHRGSRFGTIPNYLESAAQRALRHRADRDGDRARRTSKRSPPSPASIRSSSGRTTSRRRWAIWATSATPRCRRKLAYAAKECARLGKPCGIVGVQPRDRRAVPRLRLLVGRDRLRHGDDGGPRAGVARPRCGRRRVDVRQRAARFSCTMAAMTAPPDSPTRTSPFTCVLDVKASLGECPVWSVAEQVLYWVDINAPSLNRFDPATGRNTAMPMPESIGCFALRARGGFVVALRGGIWLARARRHARRARSPTRRTIRRITASTTAAATAQGRFFAGHDEREARRDDRRADPPRSRLSR